MSITWSVLSVGAGRRAHAQLLANFNSSSSVSSLSATGSIRSESSTRRARSVCFHLENLVR